MFSASSVFRRLTRKGWNYYWDYGIFYSSISKSEFYARRKLEGKFVDKEKEKLDELRNS